MPFQRTATLLSFQQQSGHRTRRVRMRSMRSIGEDQSEFEFGNGAGKHREVDSRPIGHGRK